MISYTVKDVVEMDEFKKEIKDRVEVLEASKITPEDWKNMKEDVKAAKESAERSVEASNTNHRELETFRNESNSKLNSIEGKIDELGLIMDGNTKTDTPSVKKRSNEMYELFKPNKETWQALSELTPEQATALCAISVKQLEGISDIDKDMWPRLKNMVEKYWAFIVVLGALGLTSLGNLPNLVSFIGSIIKFMSQSH